MEYKWVQEFESAIEDNDWNNMNVLAKKLSQLQLNTHMDMDWVSCWDGTPLHAALKCSYGVIP